MAEVISQQHQHSPTSISRSAAASSWSRLRGEAMFYTGLVGLFIVSMTLWAALWVIVPSLLPGWASVVITSDSMAPSIHRGDIVIAAPQDTDTLGPGTVAVFQDPDGAGLLTHRIAGVNGDGSYLTRGDANGHLDSTPIHPDSVIGVGRLLVPLFGLPMVWGLQGEWLKVTLWGATVLTALYLARHAFVHPDEA